MREQTAGGLEHYTRGMLKLPTQSSLAEALEQLTDSYKLNSLSCSHCGNNAVLAYSQLCFSCGANFAVGVVERSDN